jgi:hypothetical protein
MKTVWGSFPTLIKKGITEPPTGERKRRGNGEKRENRGKKRWEIPPGVFWGFMAVIITAS